MQKWIGLFLIAVLCSGCFFHYLMGKTETNISDDPKYALFFESTYEFISDAFLTKISSRESTWVHKQYEVFAEVGFPRTGSDLPYTIEDYERDPENWHYTDTWATKEGIAPTGRAKVIGIIPRGTRCRVFMITSVLYPPTGNTYKFVYLQLLDGEFANYIVDGHINCFYKDKLDASRFRLADSL